MTWYRGRGRAMGTSTIVLLALTALLASGLAYQAFDAGRSHEEVARASLREQATFAATNFAREARDEVLFDLFEEGIDAVEAAFDRDGSTDLTARRFRRAAHADHWAAVDETVFLFRLDLPSGSFVHVGDGDAQAVEWAHEQVVTFAREHPDEDEIQLAFPSTGSEVLAFELSFEGRGQAAIHGLLLESAAVDRAFDEAFHDEALLPEALTSGLDNDEIFVARVLGPDGRSVYASSDEPSSDITVRHDLTAELGDLGLELGIRESALGALVAGGVPNSRMPFVLTLLGLTALLLGTAVWQLNREAELARMRADFVSGVSHQLLTPLTQIRMFGETLLLGRVRSDEESRRAAEIIVDEATRLTHQVQNVLTFSAGAADGLRLRPVETDLTALVTEVVEGYEPLAGAEGASIRTAVDPDLRGFVDPDATRQALLNLLDNAMKYGHTGQTLEIGATRTADGRSVTLWVEDEGPGVPEKDRNRIWNAYVRLDHHMEGPEGGSGIGLAVVRQSVEALGGSVRVEPSRRNGGAGARFLLELPSDDRAA